MATPTPKGTVVYINTDVQYEVTHEAPKPNSEIDYLDECRWKEIRKPTDQAHKKDDTFE